MQKKRKSLVKKVISLGLALSVAATMLMGSVAVSAATATTTDKLNLRQGPGGSYQVVKVLEKNVTVTVLDSSNPDWIKVQLSDGTQGYCSAEFIKVNNTTAPPTTPQTPTDGTQRTLTMDTRSYTMAPGNIYDFRARVDGPGLNQADVKVTSSRTGIAKVARVPGTDKYRITGVAEGECYVVAEIQGVHASIKVTVKKGVKASGSSERSVSIVGYDNGSSGGTGGNTGSTGGEKRTLTLDTRFYTMAPGNIYDFRAKLDGPNLKQSDVKVTSSRTGIAKVAQVSGTDKYRVTGIAEGECYITAEIEGVHASIKITVKKGVKASGSSERSISIISGGSGDSTGGNTGGTENPGGGSGSAPNLSLDTLSHDFTAVGQTYQFIAKGIAAGSKPLVTSSDDSIVSVTPVSETDPRGFIYEIKANSGGMAIISVTVGTTSVFLMVTVAGGSSGGNGGNGGGGGNGGDGNNGGNSENTGGESESKALVKDALNLRSGPGTNYSVVRTLSKNSVVTVLDSSDSTWTKVETSDGYTGYVSAEYLQFNYTGGGGSATGLTLSNTSGSFSAGKTLYITASVSPSGTTVNWSSSNTSVATVSNGFIYGIGPGTATITASSGSYKATCNVTVTAADPVKTAYTSPNIASVNGSVELVAVTDNTRDSVRFVINMNDGTTRTLDVNNYTDEASTVTGLPTNNTRVWRTTTSFSATGTYQVTAYSYKNGSLSSSGVTTSSYVVTYEDKNISTTETRRVSNEMLTLMSKWEGYSAGVYPDTLAYNIPTIGYGQTYKAGAVFYNNITKTEAWSLLLNTVNSSYTSAVNTFITSNNLRANQNQFDAMISFSHNVGSGYWNNASAAFDIRTILLNAVDPLSVSPYTLATASLNCKLYDSSNNNANYVSEVVKGSSVTILNTYYDSSTNTSWYQVQAASGITGWAHAAYLRPDNSNSLIHDLNYVDSLALGSEWLAWHHAGGKCYAGLVYRRLGEAKVFSFGNYDEANNASSLYKHNSYGYEYPSCAKQFEQ